MIPSAPAPGEAFPISELVRTPEPLSICCALFSRRPEDFAMRIRRERIVKSHGIIAGRRLVVARQGRAAPKVTVTRLAVSDPSGCFSADRNTIAPGFTSLFSAVALVVIDASSGTKIVLSPPG